MIKFTERDPHLPGKIDERYGEGGQRNHEKDGDAALVLNLKEGARERDDYHNRDRDAADHAQKIALFSITVRRIRRGRSAFEPVFDAVVVGDRVEDDRSIDDPARA
jgi:hypothetical protein